MPLVLEDGTGVSDANSYCTEDDLETYADDRGITLAEGDEEAALIRSTTYVDGTYRMQFTGYRTLGREQGLEWPRTAAYDYEYVNIETNVIPQEIKDAVCEMAIRELAEPGSTTPDLERGGYIRSIRAGSVGIDYGGSINQTIYTIIDKIMSKLLGPSSSTYSGRAVRT